MQARENKSLSKVTVLIYVHMTTVPIVTLQEYLNTMFNLIYVTTTKAIK